MSRQHTTLLNLRAKRAQLDIQIKVAKSAVQAGSCGKALTTLCKINTLERERRTVNKQVIEAECEIKELKRIYSKR